MLYVILVEQILGPGPDDYYGVHEVPDDERDLAEFLEKLPEEFTPIVLTEDDARKLLYELSRLLE